jgi:hypothetical protein
VKRRKSVRHRGLEMFGDRPVPHTEANARGLAPWNATPPSDSVMAAEGSFRDIPELRHQGRPPEGERIARSAMRSPCGASGGAQRGVDEALAVRTNRTPLGLYAMPRYCPGENTFFPIFFMSFSLVGPKVALRKSGVIPVGRRSRLSRPRPARSASRRRNRPHRPVPARHIVSVASLNSRRARSPSAAGGS